MKTRRTNKKEEGDAFSSLFQQALHLQKQDQLHQSLFCYQKALQLKPEDATVYFNIGLMFIHLKQYDRACGFFEKALECESERADIYSQFAKALQKGDRVEEAIKQCKKAIQYDKHHFNAHLNLGLCYGKQLKLDDAIRSLKTALKLKPKDKTASVNLAFCYLLQDKWEKAWPLYEERWGTGEYSQKVLNPAPLWDGQRLKDKTILLYGEQGFGDGIQFVRYVPFVREKMERGKLLLYVRPELMRLLQGVEGIDFIGSFKDEKTILPHDFQVPLLSLPGIFKTTPPSIPSTVPYIHLKGKQSHFESLASNSLKKKVGLVWKCSPTVTSVHHKSIPLEVFKPLFELQQYQFYSLHVASHISEIYQVDYIASILDVSPYLNDFRDTAEILLQLDLVISIDTAVAHLAGALGRQVWTLLPYFPDWRWLLEGEESPWYPSMRLFRQKKPGEWTSLIQSVKEELIAL